jgi:acetyl esterase/lipase
MDQSLILNVAPPLDPEWLAHEETTGLLLPKPVAKDPQAAYSKQCKERNTQMLSGRDWHLTQGIVIYDSTVTATDGYQIPIRTYTIEDNTDDLIIYFHGGGLHVGDLDSEDLSCRRICKEASVTVISIDYRLISEVSPETALLDAWDAVVGITSSHTPRKLVVVGSSSGGQLAAQCSQIARGKPLSKPIDGLLLRGPVTVDASKDGRGVPQRFRAMHTSNSPLFSTSLLAHGSLADDKKTPNLPLQTESFAGLPKTFVQVCTNDIFYSDGICYAAALKEAGVDTKVDVVYGWPHTFWLKAPHLERALKAELDMIQGLKWLLDNTS